MLSDHVWCVQRRNDLLHYQSERTFTPNTKHVITLMRQLTTLLMGSSLFIFSLHILRFIFVGFWRKSEWVAQRFYDINTV